MSSATFIVALHEPTATSKNRRSEESKLLARVRRCWLCGRVSGVRLAQGRQPGQVSPEQFLQKRFRSESALRWPDRAARGLTLTAAERPPSGQLVWPSAACSLRIFGSSILRRRRGRVQFDDGCRSVQPDGGSVTSPAAVRPCTESSLPHCAASPSAPVFSLTPSAYRRIAGPRSAAGSASSRAGCR